MNVFTAVTSIAAAYADADINTDIIIPARFLLLPDKKGLGRRLFHEKRHLTDEGRSDFILDRPPFDQAEILVTGPNFGCGSSREQAVWALADFGIRCVIGPGFGEIFYASCFKNGLLAIIISDVNHGSILRAAERAVPITVDLVAQHVRIDDAVIAFEIAPDRRDALLQGLDEIGTILANDAVDIASFEQQQRYQQPWLYLGADKLATFADLGEEDRLAADAS